MSDSVAPTLAESWLELPDGQLFWLKGRCMIGRQDGNDLVLPLPALSRQHALLTGGVAGYTLTDLHSVNGTYLNRELVKRPTPLNDGDEISFGEVRLRYRCIKRLDLGAADTGQEATHRLADVRPRDCWLLLVDVVGYSTINERLGSEVALRRLQAWITTVRPPLEQNGAVINGYVGDAIFAYWPCETAAPTQVLTALQQLEAARPHSPLAFRVVVHHGCALFTKSEHGEELTGQDVNFLFRSEKIAKRFGVPAMLSAPAAQTLGVAGRSTALGAAAVEGMSGEFTFFGPP